MKRFTIISDPGIDDIVALVLLHKFLPKTNNCLISSFGNAPEDITAKNAKEFIVYVADHWYYMSGAKKPLNSILEHPWPDYFHGKDGIWGIHPEVDVGNVKPLSVWPRNKNVISLAPMSGLVKLSNIYKPREITVMGGAFFEEGNETKYAETNIAFDPDAAHKFFSKCDGIRVKIVPLDVTRKVFWTLDTIRSIPEDDKIKRWLKKLLLTWFKKYNHERETNFHLHDPLAVYLTFFPDFAIWKKSGVSVETHGKKRGQTTFDNNNPECEVAWNLIDATSISQKIFSLIFNMESYLR